MDNSTQMDNTTQIDSSVDFIADVIACIMAGIDRAMVCPLTQVQPFNRYNWDFEHLHFFLIMC